MEETQSLKELKAENATPDDETTIVPKDEYVEELKSDEVAKGQDHIELDDDDDESEVESWMQKGDATPDEDGKTGFVPNHEAAVKRKKAKQLKASLKDQVDENATLRARLEALEGKAPNQQAQQPQQAQLPARPTREQYGYDDEAYDIAVDHWSELKTRHIFAEQQGQAAQQYQQQQAQNQRQKTVDTGIEDHYSRAAKLIDDGLITEDSFKGADRLVRQAINNTGIGNGDVLTDQLIVTLNTLGEGSEKVMYQLGVNPSKLAQLTELMTNDTTGLSAATFLGRMQAEVTNPNKRRSNAPRPASKVDGEVLKPDQTSKMQKKYGKMTEPQDRISFKRKAKRNGVDTSKW